MDIHNTEPVPVVNLKKTIKVKVSELNPEDQRFRCGKGKEQVMINGVKYCLPHCPEGQQHIPDQFECVPNGRTRKITVKKSKTSPKKNTTIKSSPEREEFECTICHKKFSRLVDLNQHMKKTKQHGQEPIAAAP